MSAFLQWAECSSSDLGFYPTDEISTSFPILDTAMAMATEALDRIHTTAESHHRVMALEVMGRYAPVETEGQTAVRGCAVLEGVHQEAETLLRSQIYWRHNSTRSKSDSENV